MGADITKILCDFAHKTSFDDLPPETVKRIKFAILDTLGCEIFGSTTTSGTVCLNLARQLEGKEEATIVGTNVKTSCLNATLVNGTMGHRFDFDDGISGGPHAGITIIPAALAVGEREQVTGKDLLAAIDVGYELTIRVTRAMGEGSKLSLHGNCFGALGAAVAAAKLLKLDLDKMINAFGICGSLIPAFPFESFTGGAMVKDFYGGWPGYVGIMSTFLSQQGLTGLENILEAERGFYQIFSGSKFDENRILSGLGKEFVWMRGHYFKPHSACRGNHVAVDCVLKLVKEEEISPEDVDEIIVIGRPDICAMREGITPKNDIAARVSIHYTVAAAMVCGHLGVDAFSDSKLKDQDIIGLAKKVRVFVDPSIPEWPHQHGPVEIIVRLKDGKMAKARVEDDSSLTEEETIAKFKDLSSRVFSEKRTQDIISIVNKLETINNVKGLMNLLTL